MIIVFICMHEQHQFFSMNRTIANTYTISMPPNNHKSQNIRCIKHDTALAFVFSKIPMYLNASLIAAFSKKLFHFRRNVGTSFLTFQSLIVKLWSKTYILLRGIYDNLFVVYASENRSACGFDQKNFSTFGTGKPKTVPRTFRIRRS